MTFEDVIKLEERVIRVIAESLKVDESKVILEATFMGDLGAGSFLLACLVANLESEFDITIEDEEAAKLETVQDVMNYLCHN